MEEFIDIPITDTKQVRLFKLLHEGSLPLSKARLRLNDNQPKVVVDRLNLFFANFISCIPWEWPRAEVKFLVCHGFDGRKRQEILLNDNVEIKGFMPDKENPTMVIIRVWRNGTEIGKLFRTNIAKDERRIDMVETSNSNSV